MSTSLKHVFHNIHDRKNFLALTALLFVILVRIGFYILVLVRPDLSIFPDSGDYQNIADRILSQTAYPWKADDPVELWRTVGYPLLIAAVSFFWGDEIWKVAVVQLILSGLLTLFVYFYLYRSLGYLPAFLSALLLVVDPLSILLSLMILSETLFTFIFFLAFVFIARWAETKHRRYLIAAGVFLGAACLVRPLGQLFVIIWPGMILLYPDDVHPFFSKNSIGSKLISVFVLMIPVVFLLAPWAIRNRVLWNCPTISSISRISNRDYLAAKVISESENIPLSDAIMRLNETDPGPCPHQNMKYYEIILSHPKEYIKLYMGGTIAIVTGNKIDIWFQTLGINYSQPDLWQPFLNGGLKAVFSLLREEFIRFPALFWGFGGLTAFQFLIYGLALIGVNSIRRVAPASKKWEMSLMIITLITLILTPGMIGDERFRVPAQPFLICLAGYAISLKFLPLLRLWSFGETEDKLSVKD